MRVEPGRDVWLERVGGYEPEELARRRRAGYRPYVALLGSEPVALGWVATREAEIGALGLSFRVPPGERYLCDLFTVPEWRGRGIYLRLLQAILRLEGDGERFWIGYDAPQCRLGSRYRQGGVSDRRPHRPASRGNARSGTGWAGRSGRCGSPSARFAGRSKA